MPKASMLARAAVAALLAGAPGEAPAERFDIPMATRLAPIQAVDREKRTVTVCWTTGAQVMRYDWYEGKRFFEELSLDDGACDLSRLNNGAPCLNSHGVYDLDDQIGVVERAWIENGQGWSELRFPKEGIYPDADRYFAMIEDRIIRNVSVGYRVDKYQITDNQGEGLDVWRAVKWTPMEISWVTVPADAGAGVRNEQPLHVCEFLGRSMPAISTTETERVMPNPAENPTQTDAQRAAEITTARNEAAAAERTRITEVTKRVLASGLPQEAADKAITSGVRAEHIGNFILDELEARGVKPGLPANGDAARITVDEVETRREAVTEALLHRADPRNNKLTDKGRHYRGMSMLEINRDLLEARGEKVRGMSKMDLAKRSLHTTGDFPNILSNVANKSLQQGYASEVRTFLPFCTPNYVPDFKQITSIAMGEGSNLEPVNEKGEFKRGTIGESAEKYQLATYGKVFAFTRQALINDDMAAFTRLPFMFAQAGARKENDIVWAILTANAAMADGTALFHANHGNLTSGATSVLSGALGLAKMRENLRKQTGVDGKQVLNLQMKYLLLPAALETEAEKFMSPALYAAQTANVVPEFYRSLTPIVEGRLDSNSTTAFYGACDPAAMPTIEYAYLEGQEGVYMETREGFDVDGTEFKVRQDFAAKALNHRGLQKSAGA